MDIPAIKAELEKITLPGCFLDINDEEQQKIKNFEDAITSGKISPIQSRAPFDVKNNAFVFSVTTDSLSTKYHFAKNHEQFRQYFVSHIDRIATYMHKYRVADLRSICETLTEIICMPPDCVVQAVKRVLFPKDHQHIAFEEMPSDISQSDHRIYLCNIMLNAHNTHNIICKPRIFRVFKIVQPGATIIETTDLYIRKPTMNDVDGLFPIMSSSNVMSHIANGRTFTREGIIDQLKKYIAECYNMYVIVRRADKVIIGMIGHYDAHYVIRDAKFHGLMMLRIFLGESFHRMGYGKQIHTAYLAYFGQLYANITSMCSMIDENNSASIALSKSAGMHIDEELTKYVKKDRKFAKYIIMSTKIPRDNARIVS